MSRPPNQTFSVLAMFAIVLCTGYMSFGARREAEVRSANGARIIRAEAEKLQLVEDLGNEFVHNRNRVCTFKNDQIEITGTESFRLAELHRSHQMQVEEELERDELARAEHEAQSNAIKEEIYNKIDEGILKMGENAAEALQDTTTSNVNTVAGSAQQSFKVIDQMQRNHIEASKHLIKMAKKGKRVARDAASELAKAIAIKGQNEANKTRNSNQDGLEKEEEFLCLEDYNPLPYDQIFGKDGKPDHS